MCEMKCDEEKATEEEEEEEMEKAEGADLKTKTPHNDVGKNHPPFGGSTAQRLAHSHRYHHISNG